MTPSDDSITSMMGDPGNDGSTGFTPAESPKEPLDGCVHPETDEKPATEAEARAVAASGATIESAKATLKRMILLPNGSRLAIIQDGKRAAEALLIAIAYIETLKARDAEATADMVRMGFLDAEDGEKTQAIHDSALAEISSCFE